MKIFNPKKLELMEMGLINTLFRDQFDLCKNFGLFFGDGNVTSFGSFIRVKSKPEAKKEYEYYFKITYCRSKNKQYPFKLTKITPEQTQL